MEAIASVATEKSGNRKSSTVLEELEAEEKLAEARRALIDIRELMKIFEAPCNSQGWTDLERFDTIEELSECHGLEIENGEVVSLDLSGCNLTGYIPRVIEKLTSLRVLNLSKNKMVGAIPWASIKKLTSLRQLVLQREFQSTNRFDPGDMPPLSCFPSLRELDVSGCCITGEIPDSICQLVELVKVSLSWNRLEGVVPKDIGNLKMLKKFTCRCNPMMATMVPESIDKLQHIQVFDLSHRNWPELTGAPKNIIQQRWNSNVEPWNIGTVVVKEVVKEVKEEVIATAENDDDNDDDDDDAFA